MTDCMLLFFMLDFIFLCDVIVHKRYRRVSEERIAHTSCFCVEDIIHIHLRNAQKHNIHSEKNIHGMNPAYARADFHEHEDVNCEKEHVLGKHAKINKQTQTWCKCVFKGRQHKAKKRDLFHGLDLHTQLARFLFESFDALAQWLVLIFEALRGACRTLLTQSIMPKSIPRIHSAAPSSFYIAAYCRIIIWLEHFGHPGTRLFLKWISPKALPRCASRHDSHVKQTCDGVDACTYARRNFRYEFAIECCIISWCVCHT